MGANAEMFIALVKPYLQRLCALAHQYAKGRDDADELVQETLFRAWRNFAPTTDASYSPAWLVVIMRRIAAEWYRTSQRRIRLVPFDCTALTELVGADASEAFATLPPMNDVQFREFLDDRVAAALAALEPQYREVVVLSVAGNLNYRDIGEVLDCPIGTVMSRMARARRALRERLSDYAKAGNSTKGVRK